MASAHHHHHHEPTGQSLIEEAAKALTDAGEQWPGMRAEVFEALSAQPRPASAYDIAVSGSTARGSRVAAKSVYRMRDLSFASNLARRIASANAYIANPPPGCRNDCSFLICDSCGRATHLDDDSLTGALVDAARKAGFADIRPVVELRGVCSDCS